MIAKPLAELENQPPSKTRQTLVSVREHQKKTFRSSPVCSIGIGKTRRLSTHAGSDRVTEQFPVVD